MTVYLNFNAPAYLSDTITFHDLKLNVGNIVAMRILSWGLCGRSITQIRRILSAASSLQLQRGITLPAVVREMQRRHQAGVAIRRLASHDEDAH